jgi:soluble lytic murein transglycosylase-like protein
MSLRAHKSLYSLFLLAICSAGPVFGQSVLLTDGDVRMEKPGPKPKVEEGLRPVARSNSTSPRLERAFLELRTPLSENDRQRLVKLTVYRPDKILILREAVFRESAKAGIDPDLVFSVMWEESRARLNAVSPKNARGPMQMLPETAARYGARNPHDPEQAVRAGVAYLVALLDQFGGNVSLALGSYNAGPAATEAYLTGRPIRLGGGRVANPRGILSRNGLPLYNETQNYVKRIAERYRMTKNLPQ